MFNPSGQGSAFGQRLLRTQRETNDRVDPAIHTDLQQWLEYWNDAESVTSNLRKVEHWLERARLHNS